jgi:hypothetical protein
MEITDILRQPEFVAYTKLDIREDGSSIRIKKPQTWNAPWSLSRGKLREYINLFFGSGLIPTADSLFTFIYERHMLTLRQDTFCIERVVPE